MSEDFDTADEAPGWDAINRALQPIYGDREPYHVGCIVPYALGGPDPIHGISAYTNDEPLPHWHFVTYGFSELWAKESTDPEISGYGFELTFRLTRKKQDAKPPNWAFNFLQNLGRYVFQTGNTFGAGHTMPLNGPIAHGSDTLIHAITFALDPQLPPIETPNGRVEFLEIVGLTMDELAAITSWNATAFLELRSQDDPLLLTDLSRSSWMAKPSFAEEVARRTQQEGSSCGWLSLAWLECDADSSPRCIRIQSIVVEGLANRLLGRLPFGRDLALHSKEATVVFRPAERSNLRSHEGAVTVSLRDDDVKELAARLQPRSGRYPIPGIADAILEVVPTEITDGQGKVVEVVG